MEYNPEIHHRRSIRLKGYDYSQVGAYFVTICTNNRESFFENESIKEIAEKYWKEIPNNFKNIELDEYIIMPNHLHGIIVIKNVGAVHEPPNNRAIHELPLQSKQQYKIFLPQIIGWFKMNSAKSINKILKREGQPFWQRNYYEHIVRNETELNKIREYIINNPLKWELDFENPERKKEYKNFTDYLNQRIRATD